MNARTSRIRTLTLAATLVASASLAGCKLDVANPTPSSAGTANTTFLIECTEDNLVESPARFTLACADGNMILDNLVWSNWGENSATAKGELSVNECEPTCAEGSMTTVPVSVTAGDLVLGEASATYGSLKVHFEDTIPAGLSQDESFPMMTVEPGADLED